jgi:hypothetical protein
MGTGDVLPSNKELDWNIDSARSHSGRASLRREQRDRITSAGFEAKESVAVR